MVTRAVLVDAAFGFAATATSVTWTDISQYVELSERSEIRITRGAADELSQTQAGTCTVMLDNQDGRFTAGNAGSPYYPYVRPGTPVRVRVVTADKNLLENPSFEGGVSDWVSSGPPVVAASATHVQHGSQAMLITWGGVASQTVTSPIVYGLEIGKTYTFSAYVWVPTGDATVQLSLAGGSTGSASTLFDAFQRITVTFTATATSHQVRVGAVGTPTAGDQVWVDACQIEEGSSATTFTSNGATTSPRFYGMVNDWGQSWQGLESTVAVSCSDLFQLLSGAPALQSMLVEEVLQLGPVAYYPLSEPSSSTTAGDIAGTGAGSLAIGQAGVGGALAFGEGTGPPADGLSTPLFTPSSATNGRYLFADMGPDFAETSSLNYLFMEAWFSTSTTGRVIFSLNSLSGEYAIIFSLESGTGKLRIQWTTIGGPLSGYGDAVVATANLADGAQHHMLYDEQAGDIYIDGGSPISVAVDGMLNLRSMLVGVYAGDRLWSGTISHIAIHAPASPPPVSSYTDHYDAGATGFAGEDANDRVLRLAGYAGIAGAVVYGDFSPVASQGEGGQSALEMMRDVETTEGGKLFCSRIGASLEFQSRTVRYNTTSNSLLDYSDLETPQVKVATDTQKLVNTVRASRPGGATQRIASAESRTAFGPREQELTLLKTTDNQVVDAAYWLVSRYADPQPELRQVPVEAYSLDVATYRSLLNCDVSSVISLLGMPATAPVLSPRVTVEGYTETIGQASHYLDFHTSRTFADSVWVLDDTTYSVLGSTTRLAY